MSEPTTQLELCTPQGNRVLNVPPTQASQPLTELLRRAGLVLNTRCGERGLCRGCHLELLEGSLRQRSTGGVVTSEDLPRGIRACDFQPLAGTKARLIVPQRSLLAHEPQVVSSFRLGVPWTHDPVWQLVSEASPQSLQQDVREYDENGWSRLPLDSELPPLGAAIDVGTTTVALVLVDLTTGDVVGQASGLNAQAYLGDNVVTRINLCLNDETQTGELQRALIEDTLRPLLLAALAPRGFTWRQLATITVAGNTTMLHLFAGVNPGSLGVAPFTPAFLHHRRLPADAVRLVERAENSGASQRSPAQREQTPTGRAPSIHLLPGASAYVGADVVAGVLATGMAYLDEPSLLVDLGTNGELVLHHAGKLWGCATAAGPAFEGAGMLCGVRAGEGAISHVWLEPPPWHARIEVIGTGPPVGLCGTAYIDFLARGRRSGLLNSAGRFQPHEDSETFLRDPHHGRAMIVGHGPGREPVVVSEADISALLQAKAAIAAGILCLLDRAGLRPRDLQRVFLAGGFGFHMHVDSLLGCGLLPGVEPSQVHLVGNSSLAGAYASLTDSSFLDELQLISRSMEVIELNLDPTFESTYIDQLLLE